jgi:hypothetical protein
LKCGENLNLNIKTCTQQQHLSLTTNMTNHIPLGGLEGVAGVIGVTTTAGRAVVFCEGWVASSVTLTLNLL